MGVSDAAHLVKRQEIAGVGLGQLSVLIIIEVGLVRVNDLLHFRGAVILAVQYIAYRLNIVLFYVVNLYLLSTTIAAKCLQEEVMKVYDALRDKDIPKARTMVGYLVGRDTQELQEGGIVRATVETTAENTIDGVLAPIFYMIIGVVLWVFVPFINPLLLAMLYKAVNTMDSMVGYVQEPYKDFGYFPAKIDDIANFVIARIGSWFMLIGGLFLGYRGRSFATQHRACSETVL